MNIIVMAVGLFLIIEGFFPFLSPKRWRQIVQMMTKQSDNTLHITGLISMVIGLILLYIAHHYL